MRFSPANPGEIIETDLAAGSQEESPVHHGANSLPIPGEVHSEADDAMLLRAARSKSCLKSDFDAERSNSRKSRMDSRGVVIDSERKQKVLFVDEVHEDAPIEEVKEVAPVKNKGGDCCTIL